MKKLIIALVILLSIVFFSTVFIVDVTEQVVILQFGKPIKTIKEPGLHFKLPIPFQNAVVFDNRLLEYDVPPEEILSKDKKSLIVDNYVRWKIVDPLLFLQTVQAIPTAITRLDDIVYSELRRELGIHEMSEIITENREIIMKQVTSNSKTATSPYGIEVVDVRIKRVDLPKENQKSIYEKDRRISSDLKVMKKNKKSMLQLKRIKLLFWPMPIKRPSKSVVKVKQQHWKFMLKLLVLTLISMSLSALWKRIKKSLTGKLRSFSR